jgi:hypothetical protein
MYKSLGGILIVALVIIFQITQPVVSAQITATPVASATPTSPLLELTPVLGTTPLPTQLPIGAAPPPPIDIILPPGWAYAYRNIPIRDSFITSTTNIAIYQGPMRSGIATIVVLWGFPALAPQPSLTPIPGTATAIPESPEDFIMKLLWLNGLRLLQGTIVDISCNIHHYGMNTGLTVGKMRAIGEIFAVTQCQNEPDTVGWFVGTQQHGINYLFYIYVEPVEVYNEGRGDLQAILDSVVFHEFNLAGTASAAPQASATPSS